MPEEGIVRINQVTEEIESKNLQGEADFDEAIWNELVDFVTVKSKKELVLTFFDGTEVTVS